MSEILPVDLFLSAPGSILDVRSPGEFNQGHIPGAVNLPLFSDDERATVGTCYKHEGREAAVELGFEIVGPKQATLLRQAKAIAAGSTVRLHCWRGGLRSESVAWLLTTGGLQTATLEGGYKAFRRWVRTALSQSKPIQLLGGMTGTGKTDILHCLHKLGEQVLDLEGVANHRGSSFGALGLPPQPSTEQFENLLAFAWQKFDPSRPIWIEAESRNVGSCRIPPELFDQMSQASALAVTRSRSERVALLVECYGQADAADLIAATERIRKRLGGDRTQSAVSAIEHNDLATAVEIILNYYDRAYTHDLQRRNQTIPEVSIDGLSAQEAALTLTKIRNSTKMAHKLGA
ncbi:MAG: tRNA 2-selenouridine(34) synthase MnmH [Cyanobacteria bacterium P01_H01_bin.119]